MGLLTHLLAAAMALAVVGFVVTERREGHHSAGTGKPAWAPHPEADVDAPTFQAFKVVAPALTGRMLQLTSLLLRVPVLGDLAIAQIKRDNDFASVTRLANRLAGDYEPVSRPVVIPTHDERQQHEAWATQAAQNGPVPLDASPVSNGKNPFMYDTAAVFTQAYVSKKLTPAQAISRVLDDVEAINPSLGHTVSQLLRRDAMRAAAESTARYAAGKPLGPLDGLPIVVKSEVRVANASQTLGTSFYHKIMHGGDAKEDDDPVARLRAAGCIVVGVAPMHELGVGVTGNNPSERTALNPHNTKHYSGGSSSGSAVAVAANLVPLAVGTDGGGSIRVPSGLCGVWGLKPTYDRVGRRPILSVGSIGPIGTSVRDVALAYVAMSGASPPPLVKMGKKPNSGAAHPSSYQPPAHLFGVFTGEPASRVKGLRVGYLPSFAASASKDVLKEHDDTLKRLQAAGATLVNVEPIPYLHIVMRAHVVLIYSEMAAMADRWWASYASELNPESLTALVLGAAFTSREMLHAQKIRAWMMDVFRAHVFSQCDVVLMPGAGVASPRIPEGGLDGFGESNLEQVQQIMRFMFLANFLGLPSGAAPTNFDANGLPLGVQVMANHWNEHVVLRVMSFLEHDAVRVRGVWPRRPQVAASTGSGGRFNERA